MTSNIGFPITVVIPALNEERYLPVLLESLFACAPREMEIIVSDGASDDGTLEVVASFASRAPQGIRLLALTTPIRNVSYQRNVGAAAASHPVLLFLDADTAILSPSCLDELLRRFDEGRYAAASCRFEPLERDARAVLYYRLLYAFHKLLERWNPYALGACILTTRRTLDRCHGFDPSIRVNEDAHFCREAARGGRFGILPVPVGVSTRRFQKFGYFRMGIQYLRIFLDRTLRGEMRDDRIHYEFGKY